MGERASEHRRTDPRTKRITDAARPFATAISPIVLGRADKLSGIMPASQSINYEREIGCETEPLARAHIVVCMLNARVSASGLLEDRVLQPPTCPRSISLIIQSVASKYCMNRSVAASSQKSRACSFF